MPNSDLALVELASLISPGLLCCGVRLQLVSYVIQKAQTWMPLEHCFVSFSKRSNEFKLLLYSFTDFVASNSLILHKFWNWPNCALLKLSHVMHFLTFPYWNQFSISTPLNQQQLLPPSHHLEFENLNITQPVISIHNSIWIFTAVMRYLKPPHYRPSDPPLLHVCYSPGLRPLVHPINPFWNWASSHTALSSSPSLTVKDLPGILPTFFIPCFKAWIWLFFLVDTIQLPRLGALTAHTNRD